MSRLLFRNFSCYFLLSFLCCLVVFLSGCQDTTAVHQASELETCKGLIDEENWEDAISACEDVDSDEGWHLAAQAYMGRAGLSLFDVINSLTNASESEGASTVIFNYLPDTAADEADYQSALDSLLGTNSSGNSNINEKTQTMYLEALLVSSMLIFKELKTLLGLSVVNGAFSTCSLDSSADNTCTFIPSISTQTVDDQTVPEKLVFGGLGSSFYTAICGQANDSSYDGTKETTVTTDQTYQSPPYDYIEVTITNDITVDSCTIQTGSPLYYNKVASQGFTDSGQISGLDVLDFYSKMDQGENFSFEVVAAYDSVDAVELAFCNQGYIALPDASDDKINDCEILSMFTDESSDLF